MNWAQYEACSDHTREGPAVGRKCLACATVHTRAWAHLSWDTFLSMARTSTSFSSQVGQAKQVLAGKLTKTFIPETLEGLDVVEMRCEKQLVFMTLTQFESKFGVKATTLGVSIDEIVDEAGVKTTGVLMTDASAPYRKVVMSHRAGLMIRKSLCNPDTQLRSNQCEDTRSWL